MCKTAALPIKLPIFRKQWNEFQHMGRGTRTLKNDFEDHRFTIRLYPLKNFSLKFFNLQEKIIFFFIFNNIYFYTNIIY